MDILKNVLRCEYVDKWLQTINIVIHNQQIAQLVAPFHFYTYEQAPTITTTKTNKQSKNQWKQIYRRISIEHLR